MSFKSLAERLANPGKPFDENGMVLTDYAYTNAESNLHASLVGLLEFNAANGRMPKANDEPDAQPTSKRNAWWRCGANTTKLYRSRGGWHGSYLRGRHII